MSRSAVAAMFVLLFEWFHLIAVHNKFVLQKTRKLFSVYVWCLSMGDSDR